MALESLPKIAPALFSAEQDLIQIYNKKSDTFGVINASLIGGNTPPSGVSGAIQFSNGSAFASDASNLFWDDTNNRLGIGTNAPTQPLSVNGQILSINGRVSTGTTWIDYDGTFRSQWGWLKLSSSGDIRLLNNASIGGDFVPTATTHIKGSGSTSATTSLLVQNSSSETKFFVDDSSVGAGCSIGNLINGYSSLQWNANMVGFGLISGGGLAARAGVSFVISDSATPSNTTSAKLVVNSTSMGFLPPRMSTAQKNAISTPAAGLVVFDTDLNKLCVRGASAWETITSV